MSWYLGFVIKWTSGRPIWGKGLQVWFDHVSTVQGCRGRIILVNGSSSIHNSGYKVITDPHCKFFLIQYCYQNGLLEGQFITWQIEESCH